MTDHDKPMSMVERCARAICVADAKPLGASTMSWETISESHRDTFRTLARAAISAMRKPDKAMLNAACSAMSPGKRPTQKRVSCKAKHGIRYRAMIDAALTDPK